MGPHLEIETRPREGAGIADGLGYGDNTKAALMTRGLAELARLGVALGGDPLTFAGLAGMGGLIATEQQTSTELDLASFGMPIDAALSPDGEWLAFRVMGDGSGMVDTSAS